MTLPELRQLVRQVGQVKAIEGRVTHAGLLWLAQSQARVRRARSYLAAAQNLTELQRRALIWNLLGGLATGDALSAVLDLLLASSPDDLGRLFEDGRLAERLHSAIPAGHSLHGKLAEFTAERFGERPERLTRRVFQHHRGKLVRSFEPRVPRADRTFSPKMIDPSLGADVDGTLTPRAGRCGRQCRRCPGMADRSVPSR